MKLFHWLILKFHIKIQDFLRGIPRFGRLEIESEKRYTRNDEYLLGQQQQQQQQQL